MRGCGLSFGKDDKRLKIGWTKSVEEKRDLSQGIISVVFIPLIISKFLGKFYCKLCPNSFLVNVPILYTLKTENQKFSGVSEATTRSVL